MEKPVGRRMVPGELSAKFEAVDLLAEGFDYTKSRPFVFLGNDLLICPFYFSSRFLFLFK
ncbi:hypothetical protein Loa_01928 [Legionella oakridgensis ATCC 33761 = DSM 21215]|uniref:Uncharacterized protein n=2 Tax=Legionella oakridgensis TaxID=29423 RepID=W0BGB3_9GAMM|nr:hypothetical protein Loa_01928 [Legionella oakridgensis ATCC 33761 = DSM 21215]ETO93004.1 hypothetical protein LOR_44c07320 [Legionella oakridgensis RV-2-2007]KTD43532.1 hypothetical protein Loak_0707 [Legionella oakridgensis]STY20524.1 Uncharacterised protein [Legionella longbeachae]